MRTLSQLRGAFHCVLQCSIIALFALNRTCHNHQGCMLERFKRPRLPQFSQGPFAMLRLCQRRWQRETDTKAACEGAKVTGGVSNGCGAYDTYGENERAFVATARPTLAHLGPQVQHWGTMLSRVDLAVRRQLVDASQIKPAATV
jgi:hypothetical protein